MLGDVLRRCIRVVVPLGMLALWTGAALADGYVVPKATVVAAPAASWTGCYVGIDTGYKWGQTHLTTPDPLHAEQSHAPLRNDSRRVRADKRGVDRRPGRLQLPAHAHRRFGPRGQRNTRFHVGLDDQSGQSHRGRSTGRLADHRGRENVPGPRRPACGHNHRRRDGPLTADIRNRWLRRRLRQAHPNRTVHPCGCHQYQRLHQRLQERLVLGCWCGPAYVVPDTGHFRADRVHALRLWEHATLHSPERRPRAGSRTGRTRCGSASSICSRLRLPA